MSDMPRIEVMPLWAKMLLSLGVMGMLSIFALVGGAVYLLGGNQSGGAKPAGPTGLVKVFPGDDRERLLWAGLLAQYGDGVERDGGTKLPTLLSRRMLKNRWVIAQQYRMDFRGEGDLWGPEYQAFGAELERRVDAVVDEGDLSPAERSAVRMVLRGAAEELAGDAWEDLS